MNTRDKLRKEYNALREQKIKTEQKIKAIRDAFMRTKDELRAQEKAHKAEYGRKIVLRWVNGETMVSIARSLGIHADTANHKAIIYLREVAPLEFKKTWMQGIELRGYVNEHRAYFKIPEAVDAPAKQ